MLVSLCMIAKDEQELLGACLESVQGIVDEIVLVDTGSTDKTVAIAESHGARVFHQQWTGDFSEARNFGIAQATGEWILILDADERLTLESAKVLRGTLELATTEGLRVVVRDRVREGGIEDFLINSSTRLFRNRPEYRYQRRVHEQIESSIVLARLGPSPVSTNLIIDHLGYLPEVVKRKQKRQRNLQLMEEEAGTVGDGFSFYNLGVEYIRHGRHQEALVALNKSLDMLDPALLVSAEALHRKAVCLMEMQDYAAALKTLDQGIARYRDFTDLVFHKAEVLCQLQRYREATASFLQCRRMGAPQAGYYSLEGIGGYRAAYALGLVYQLQRNFSEAMKWYQQSLKEKSSHIPSVNRISEVLKEVLPLERVADELAKYFDLQQSESNLAYAHVVFSAGCYQAALNLAQKLLVEHPGATSLLSIGAVSAFHCGHYQQCLIWAEELIRRNGSMLEPLLLVVVARWIRNEMPEAQAAIGRLSGRGEDMLQTVCQQMQWYVEGRQDFSLSIDFSDPNQRQTFHDGALQLLRLVVITGNRELLSKLLPILSPLEGLGAWQQLGLYYYQYDLPDLAWAELRDCEQQGQTSPEAHLVLGKLAFQRRALRVAVGYLQRTMEELPANLEVRQLLADCCRQLAEQILLEGIEQFPDAPMLVSELAKLKKGEEEVKC